jgi:hypothetical protein
MKLRTYFEGLDSDAKSLYAKRAGTSLNYMQIHLFSEPPRKIPRPEMLRRLAKASSGAVSFKEVLSHFYEQHAAA